MKQILLFGHIDVKYAFNLNKIFMEHGFIRVDENNNVKDYDAYSFSAGFSTHIMIKDKENIDVQEKVYSMLKKIKEEYPDYIETLYTAKEAIENEGLAGDFSFVIEGTEGVVFLNDVSDDLIISSSAKNYKYYKGMHGHHPSKGNKPPFIVYGPAITNNIVIESGDMIDECPTLARLLDVEMPNMDGKEFPIF